MALGYRHEFTCTNGTIPKCMNTFREDFDSRDTPSRDTIPTHGFVVPFMRWQMYLKRCVVTILLMELHSM